MGRSTPNIYSPAAGDKLIPGATAIDQFGKLASGATLLGKGLSALCGEASQEIIYAWAKGTAPSRDHIYSVFQQMFSQGLTVGRGASQGVSTPQTVSKELSQNEGIPNYVTKDWESAIETYAGERPIQIMTQSPDHNLGAELPGDEFHDTGHFYTVEGFSPSHDAFIVSDPDNSAAKSGQLVYYTLAEMQAGGAQEAIVPQLQSGAINGGVSAVPANSTTQLSATSSIPIISGLGTAAQNLLQLPQAAEQGTGAAIGTGIAVGVETLWNDTLGGLGVKSGSNLLLRGAVLVGGAGLVLIGLLTMSGAATEAAIPQPVKDEARDILGGMASPVRAAGQGAASAAVASKLKKTPKATVAA